eukprot:CAMPEP_0179217124 /NCGR_PEP_ID=MMETSP0797-20121207/3755_1 /TAXON_ID=47934 /ORGANISM="Dinophysis acuminata, Strain DAEP01" /LENGTH=254 /DNA_ID=CAMNT_0020923349 /DNA_START=332 /DNA_END=1092 /DNA_ORIENTATION=+
MTYGEPSYMVRAAGQHVHDEKVPQNVGLLERGVDVRVHLLRVLLRVHGPVHAGVPVVDGVVAVVAGEEVEDWAREVPREVVLVLLGRRAPVVLRKVDGYDGDLREELREEDEADERLPVPEAESGVDDHEQRELAQRLPEDRPIELALDVQVLAVLDLNRHHDRGDEEEQVKQVAAPPHLRGPDHVLRALGVLVVREVVAGDQRGHREAVGKRQHELPDVVGPRVLELRHVHAVVDDRGAEPREYGEQPPPHQT